MEPRSTYPEEFRTLGNHIRKRRLELGLSQAALAKHFGVDRNAVTRWEAGLDEPGLQQMPTVVEFLGEDSLPSEGALAEQIRSMRRARSISQAQFGEVLGLNRETAIYGNAVSG